MSGDNSGIATGNGKVTITGNVYVGSELSVNPRTAWISTFPASSDNVMTAPVVVRDQMLSRALVQNAVFTD